MSDGKIKILLKSLLSRSQNEPPLSDLEQKEQDNMIDGVRRLSEKTAKEVMVPRVDVTALPHTTPMEEVLETVIASGFSRLPVYSETIDNLSGVLYVKDLFEAFYKNADLNLNNLLHAPYFVPESIKLDILLRELKKRKTHIAITVDEYGGFSGIVSMEDIVEEIIGDVQDEFDKEEEEEIVRSGENAFFCDARVSLDDFNEIVGTDIDEDVETLGGFLFDLLGKIPTRFERIEYQNLVFIIQSMNGNKIERVRVLVEKTYSENNS